MTTRHLTTTDLGSPCETENFRPGLTFGDSDAFRLASDLLVFSPYRWQDLVDPTHHPMMRMSKGRRLFFIEPARLVAGGVPQMQTFAGAQGVRVVVPYLPTGLTEVNAQAELRSLLQTFLKDEGIDAFTSWYYTPTALEHSLAKAAKGADRTWFRAVEDFVAGAGETSARKPRGSRVPDLRRVQDRLTEKLFGNGLVHGSFAGSRMLLQ